MLRVGGVPMEGDCTEKQMATTDTSTYTRTEFITFKGNYGTRHLS